MTKLSKLTQIDGLYFISTTLCDEDLVHLPDVHVTKLLFWNAGITDASIDSMASVQGLKKVLFKATSISPAGVEELQAKLPELEIVVTK